MSDPGNEEAAPRGLSMLTLAAGLLAATALPVLGLATTSGAVPPPAPQLTVSPDPVVFAPTTVGDFSDAIDVTLTNMGSAPDTLTGDSYTGARPERLRRLPVPRGQQQLHR